MTSQPRIRKRPSAAIEEKGQDRIISQLETVFHQAFSPEDAYIPPQREHEFREINQFCSDKAKSQQGGALYVSGYPGIGKTLTVLSVLSSFRPKTQAILTNAMSISTTRGLLATVCSSLGLSIPACRGANDLSRLRYALLNAPTKSRMLIFMIDEVDVLAKKQMALLQTLIGWAHEAGSRLIFIGIANTLDLLERVMARQSANDLPPVTSLHFKSYTAAQLLAILNQRVDMLDAATAAYFEQPALKYIATRVAAESGDARRALDLCRRAVLGLIASEKAQGEVTESVSHVSLSSVAKGSSAHATLVARIKSLPHHAAVLLCALVRTCRSSVRVVEMHNAYSLLCRTHKLTPQSPFSTLVSVLEDSVLITRDSSRKRKKRSSLQGRGVADELYNLSVLSEHLQNALQALPQYSRLL